MLPDINGIEVSRRIKAAHPGIVVLQTSAAVTSPHDRAVALDGGADGFLVEPIEPEELLATAQALLRMRGAEQALRRLNESLELLVAERTRELTEANRRLEIEIAERRKTEEVLWHTQKLEAVGQLTGGIAHDFNNLLAVIVGSMEMIRAAFEAGGDLPRAKILRLLKASEAATGRATKLTQQLLAFARRSTFTLDIVALDEVLVGVRTIPAARAGRDDRAGAVNFEPDLWLMPDRYGAVRGGDPQPCRQRPRCHAAGRPTGDRHRQRRDRCGGGAPLADLTAGAYVLVRISRYRHRHGSRRRGARIRAVLHHQGGRQGHRARPQPGLWLHQAVGRPRGDRHRTPGVGTTFRLYLPRCEHVRQTNDTESQAPSATPTGHETVLVVEDNAEVLELAVTTISDLGYRVLTAADGPSALNIVRRDETIDLLFSDVVMPGGMNGFELISQARDIRAGLKALVTSGYANVHRPGADRPDVPLLLKPYRRADLAQCIRMALDRA